MGIMNTASDTAPRRDRKTRAAGVGKKRSVRAHTHNHVACCTSQHALCFGGVTFSNRNHTPARKEQRLTHALFSTLRLSESACLDIEANSSEEGHIENVPWWLAFQPRDTILQVIWRMPS